MDQSMAMASDRRRFQLSNMPPRQAMVPQYDLNLSLLCNPSLTYPIHFNPTPFNYSSQVPVLSQYDSYGGIAPRPTISIHPPMTIAHDLPFVREARNAMVDLTDDPPVKLESKSPQQRVGIFGDRSPGSSTRDASFGTDVDTLMRAIQTKSKGKPQQPSVSFEHLASLPSPTRVTVAEDTVDPESWAGPDRRSPRSRKRYQCNVPGCGKSFFQKTHLEIHMRAHTGYKPFLCREPTCGQRFSQLGNLRTHERRHTGERPYSCESCGKRFAQRGNVRAHRIVHEQIKPFTCRLESCGKQFTQLGNLKSHQNKFHANTLRTLTLKFASMREGDAVSAADKDLWEYFSTLYKNSNKGIKGRGKDRRISTTRRSDGATKHEDRSRSSSMESSSSESGELFERRDDASSTSSVDNEDHEYGTRDAKMG